MKTRLIIRQGKRGTCEGSCQPRRLFAKKVAAITDDLLAQRKIKIHPPKVMEGGLDKVLDGLDLLRNNKVGEQKLVYRVE